MICQLIILSASQLASHSVKHELRGHLIKLSYYFKNIILQKTGHYFHNFIKHFENCFLLGMLAC
jgi:hypothetical protein